MTVKLWALFALLRETFDEWLADRALRMGAALAYYSLFSIAPLFIVAAAVVCAVYGERAAQHQLGEQLEEMLGATGARAVEEVVGQANQGQSTGWAAAFGLVALLVGASGVFSEMQDALNTIWKVVPKSDWTWFALLRDRLLSFTMVVTVGFLLLVSLVVTTSLSALSNLLTPASLPGGALLWQGVNALASYLIITLLFALIYKVLPDVQVGWDNVWVGAFVTSLLFTVGKDLIGLYLGKNGLASAYGAAGSLVLVLSWVYYSSLIFLFGAEFTRVYARKYGSAVVPGAHAQSIEAAVR